MEDETICNRVVKTLEKWKRVESEKQARLSAAGIFGINTPEDVKRELARIEKEELSKQKRENVAAVAADGTLEKYLEIVNRLERNRRDLTNPQQDDLSRLDKLITVLGEKLGPDWQMQIDAFRRANLLVSCTPKPLDAKMDIFLKKYEIGLDLTSEMSEKIAINIRKRRLELMQSSEFQKQVSDLELGSELGLKELYGYIDDLRIVTGIR